MNDYEYDESRVSELLPDRSGTDLPPQVHHFLALCEVAVTSERFSRERRGDPEYHFVEGVVDYYWSDGLDEPYWEQLFYTDLSTGRIRDEPIPEHSRFCYQQGAMVGYRLREEFRHEDEEAA